MADLNDDSLKRLLGDDPIITSASVRIRQDEQTLASLTRHFTMLRREAEGIAKALKEAGVSMKGLGGIGGGGGGGIGRIGDTDVAGSFTPPQHSGTPMALDLSTAGGRGGAGGGGRMGRITSAFVGNDGQLTKLGAGAVYGAQMLDAGIQAMDQRIERGYQYSLSADRMNMLFQQMKGMSQQAIQDTYRQPLTQYKLGSGGINALLGLEAGTGISAAQQAASVEALRVSSGFSVNAQQAAGILGGLASPQVANRMFMMAGTSLVRPGGGYRPMNEVMQSLVRSQGLTDPRVLRGAMAPGSVTRANLTNVGVSGEFQTQVLQYAQQNLAFQQKGGSGMYDPSNKAHQKLMGISDNFAMQQEESDRRRIEREENFYSRQADNFADLEKQTQRLIAAMGGLENAMSGLFGLRTSTKGFSNIGSGVGTLLGGIAGSFLPVPGGTMLGALAGSQVGRFVGSIIPTGDAPGFITADRAERAALNKPIYGPPVPKPSIWKSQPSTTISGFGVGKRVSSSSLSASSARTADAAARRLALSAGVTLNNATPITADMAERRALNLGNGSTGLSLATPFTEAKMSPKEIRYKNTPIYGPNGEPTNLYDLMSNPRVSGQFAGFTAGWMDLYADYYAETKDVGTLNAANRTFQEQENMWLERMTPTGVTEKGNIPPGSRNDWYYQGQYWVKKSPELADVAWPGAPWANHQHGLAVDLHVGNKDAWSDFNRKNASSYGIEWFGDVNNEPWHLQMAGTRVRGSGGGAGFAARVGFSAPDPSAPVTASDLQGRRKSLNLYGEARDTLNGLGSTRLKGMPPDVAERRLAANKALLGMLSSGSSTTPTGVAGRTISSGAYVSGKPLSLEELGDLYYNTGFRGEALATIMAITMRESGGDPTAKNPNNELSFGLAQHNMDPNTTSDVANRQAWGLATNEDLFDPNKNAWVTFEKYKYNIYHGLDPFEQWGPYKGVPSLHGKALDYIDAARAIVTKKYGSIQQGGDGLPPEAKPAYKPEPRMPTTTTGTPIAGASAGSPAMVRNGDYNINVSPTININTSGNNLDQDLENMARKVAMMLEREVSRTMIRRT